MGNCVSRCAQNTRGKLLPCSRKQLIEDEPMLSSTYDSEAPHDHHKNNYQGPCRYPSEPIIDRSGDGTAAAEGNTMTHREGAGSRGSLTDRGQRSRSDSPTSQQKQSSTNSTPKSSRFKFSWRGYRSLRSGSGSLSRDQKNNQQSSSRGQSSNDVDGHKLVDTGSQTVIHGDTLQRMASAPLASSTPGHTPGGLTKEYIVKTYSIQNATPSPTTNPKFSPANAIVAPPLHNVSSRSSSSSSKGAGDLNSTPNTPPPAEEETIVAQACCKSLFSSPPPALPPRQPTTANRTISVLSFDQQVSHSSPPTADGPLSNLEQKQMEVLDKLEKLKGSVEQLAQKYNVSTSSPSSSPLTSTGQGQSTPKSLGNCVQDIVISADPSSIPLSLIILGQELDRQYSVFKSTFVHSSVTGQVPDSLKQMMTSNGGRSRANSQIAITLVWKKVTSGPQMVVDPTRQTPIQGEANIVRYLARLLQPAYDDSDDILTSTQIDDFLDLAQMQMLEGNAKEKSAAVRSINSALGKKDWLVGGGPSIADFVCWSALHQAGQTSAPPSNIKKWLTVCNSHAAFSTASTLVNVMS